MRITHAQYNSTTMKVPSGQHPNTPSGQTTGAQPATPPPAAAKPTETVSARQMLDALQLANREATLAKVAKVLNREGSSATQLLLDVKGKPLLVEAAIGKTPVEAGEWVKVMRAGNELQLIGKLATSELFKSQEAEVARALVQRLPWQHSLDTGLARLLGSLTQGLKPDPVPGQPPSAGLPTPLPEPARQALSELIARLPNSASLPPGQGNEPRTPQSIRQWISESGLFTEARLSQSSRTEQAALPDLKLAIGRVITALLAQPAKTPEALSQFNRLTPATSQDLIQAPLQFPIAGSAYSSAGNAGTSEPVTAGQMLRLLAGMLNRITVNQLHSQTLSARAGGDAGSPASVLLLDLPWLTPQNEPRIAQLRLEHYSKQERHNAKETKAAAGEWRLSLAIDLDEAGPLHFDVALREQSVSATVWANQQDTLKQVNEQLPLLRKSLSGLGLEVTDLDCRQGRPQASTTRLEHRLVDTRA
ncbi:flagellar hook-length control protein FliK [Marinobacter salinisoli]|uniref:Flagellar hook-length control protein FliK n=1 Tax=Marinobacter salinisoli TaxID=2769486 RepID=A0ABX7MPY9_9GAMM|nr:flagellar hook-length control protein FliK [Marinobacter salinisoli]QSP94375.1 flagellar hook-length control protein FliK [Marinobacter salinisoli]